MSNEGTKEQIKRFFDKAIDDARDIDKLDKKLRKEKRIKRKDKLSHKFGL